MYNFTKFNEVDSGYGAHTLRNLHCYGKLEEIMDKIDRTTKGRIMNIKENLYI
jgi:hypothetical protein